MSIPKNCHYVTRGLTKPWEAKDRNLWFYDFEKAAVRQLSSKSLFAGEGLLTPEAELRFKQLIEDPLMEFRQNVLKDPSFTNFEWPVFRATSLYFMGQVQRFSVFLGDKKLDGSLEQFLKNDEKYHDQLATVSQARYQMIGITIPAGQQLFFPQTGFFSFYFLDNKQKYGYSSELSVMNPSSIRLAKCR